MISLDDIKGMSQCTDEEIEAIAMHEGVPDSIASEIAAYLVSSPEGIPEFSRMILEDIYYEKCVGHNCEAAKLEKVLLHFIATHPVYH